MTSTSEPVPDPGLFLQALTAAQQLSQALARHHLVLPQLRGSYPVRDCAQVDLGRCPAETVQALSALLDRLPPPP